MKVLLKSLVAVVLLGLLVAVQPTAQAASRPTVTNLSTSKGPQAGGTKLTITGSNFSGVESVKFGTVKGTRVRVLSSTKLTVKVPVGKELGAVQVVVTTRAGSSATSKRSRYTYLPMSTVETTGYFTCRVTTGGEGSCWGRNIFNTVSPEPDGVFLDPEPRPGDWNAIYLADSGVCGVTAAGSGECWGLTSFSDPLDSEWATLSPYGYGVCGIKTDETLWCQGPNARGQVGIGSAESYVEDMTQVGTETWSHVSLDYYHACGIQTSGAAACWGADSEAQIGNPAVDTDVNAPFVLTPGSGWTSVSVEIETVCGVADSDAYCWGKNGSGQAGIDNSYAEIETPTQLPGNWSSVVAGVYTGCGIQTDGSAWCWGDDSRGMLGSDDNTPFNSTVPVEVDGEATWRSLAVGTGNVCGIQTNRTLWCWGTGEVGTNGVGNTDDLYSPQQVGSKKWWSITITDFTACGVRMDNTVWCWGRNQFDETQIYGAVGNGTGENQLTPFKVPNV